MKVNMDKNILKLPFDIYGRYQLISELINKNRYKKKLKILDIGGDIGRPFSALQQFLLKDEVYVIDKSKNCYERYTRSDALKLPFKKKFDFIVSADVFEHIPQKDREKFLQEQMKLVNKAVILSAPFNTKEVLEAEQIVNKFYTSLTKKKHPWLYEHKKYSLPYSLWLEQYLKRNKLNFNKFYQNYIPYWILMMSLQFFIDNNPNYKEEIESINIYYNKRISKSDRKNPAYRTIYYISKDKIINKISTEDKDFFYDLQLKFMELLGRSNRNYRVKINLFENELNNIYTSKIWKILSMFRKVKDK